MQGNMTDATGVVSGNSSCWTEYIRFVDVCNTIPNSKAIRSTSRSPWAWDSSVSEISQLKFDIMELKHFENHLGLYFGYL